MHACFFRRELADLACAGQSQVLDFLEPNPFSLTQRIVFATDPSAVVGALVRLQFTDTVSKFTSNQVPQPGRGLLMRLGSWACWRHAARPDDHAPDAMARSEQSIAHLALLKARLTIYLYRHPVRDCLRVVDAIENADSLGDIRLLLDYILDARHRPGIIAAEHARHQTRATRG